MREQAPDTTSSGAPQEQQTPMVQSERVVIPIAAAENDQTVKPSGGAPSDGTAVVHGPSDTISLYQAHEKIYPRAVTGVFARWRWVFVWLTQIVFYGLPWLEWGQRQAVLFDLGVRRFYIFGLVLYPQDFIYLTALLVISAFSLFLFTAVAGRLWCGYTCPQTVYTEMFLWLEKLVEGDRNARIRLDRRGFTLERVAKKCIKHALWLALAFWTGFTFVGYFTPIKELAEHFLTWSLGNWEVFWVFFYGFATYGNAGWMREQVCKYMCPYARFQSAMFDKDTLIVSYDEGRGEPRGKHKRGVDVANLGDCIDCGLCVQVCPTGIDIRNGLQYECIGCGACADVCDTVMEKASKPKGLVRYTTQTALEQGWGHREIMRRIMRPRVLLYSALLWLIIIAVAISLSLRKPFKVNVIKDRGVLARIEGDKIENVYRLQIMNATEEQQTYTVQVQGLDGISIASNSSITVASTQDEALPVRVQIPYESAQSGTHPIVFIIAQGRDKAMRVTEDSTFIVPR